MPESNLRLSRVKVLSTLHDERRGTLHDTARKDDEANSLSDS